MTYVEQLTLWVEGTSLHDHEHEQCCPDFSCCQPQLLASKEEREHFLVSEDIERDRMLIMFLGRALPLMTSAKVHIAGPQREEE